MDEFRVDLDPLERPENRRLRIHARAVLNGEQLPEVFSVCDMLPAIERSGRYPLFTCTCGIFGCGGYWVDVECTGDVWIWKNGYYLADGDELEDQWRMYEFEYRIPWS